MAKACRKSKASWPLTEPHMRKATYSCPDIALFHPMLFATSTKSSPIKLWRFRSPKQPMPVIREARRLANTFETLVVNTKQHR